jgi:homoserine dehydrogenase
MNGNLPLRIGLAGLGTVGCGALRLLEDERDIITRRAGRGIEVVAVSARNKNKKRECDFSRFRFVDDPKELAALPDVDVIVEVMGGESDPALGLVRASLVSGKSVVTANKALLAMHGIELASLAEKNSAKLMIEAAVLGGVPVIKTLREGLAANTVTEIFGILNGTCNYILTRMEETGETFADILQDAQKMGYAEAEPSLDVDGFDAAHKLCLLSALAFGVKPDMSAVRVSGIRAVTFADLQTARKSGARLRLVGRAVRQENGKIHAVVEPMAIPETSMLAHLQGTLNGVSIQGSHAGEIFICGRGAGAEPTASAVVADLVDLARGGGSPFPFGIKTEELVFGLEKGE